MDIDGLQERIGYRFDEPGLLTQALTHRSHGQPNNERLEFLGDSVLNCAIATVLFERFPDVDEGDLSRSRAFLVKQQALHKVAQRLALGESLVLGAGESRSGGTRRPSILADALEALIGAVYLDSGFEAAKSLIGRLYEPELVDADPLTLGKDAKTLLQEELQQKRLSLPVYSVVATHGAAHNQEFEVECVIPRLDISVLGRGGSRRAAEQSAADAALSALSQVKSPKSTKKARKATKKRGAAKKARPATMKSASAKDAVADKSTATEKATPPAASRARTTTKTGKSRQSAARAEKTDAPDTPGKESPVGKGGKVNGSDKPVKADGEVMVKTDSGPSSAADSSSSKTPDATESV